MCKLFQKFLKKINDGFKFGQYLAYNVLIIIKRASLLSESQGEADS